MLAPRLVALVLGLGLFACSEAEPEGGANANNDDAGAASDANPDVHVEGSTDAADADARDAASDVGDNRTPCGSCSAMRASACQDAISACTNDPECAQMRECVYGQAPGCPRGALGSKCVEKCIQDLCTTSDAGKLLLEAERCQHCAPVCSSSCSAYCDGFTTTPQTFVCFSSVEGGLDDGGPFIPDGAVFLDGG